MDWISYVFTALLAVNLGVEIYLIIKKRKEDKAKYRFVVCKQDGKNLIPIDSFDCASDAHQHYAYRADTMVVRIAAYELDYYYKELKHAVD